MCIRDRSRTAPSRRTGGTGLLKEGLVPHALPSRPERHDGRMYAPPVVGRPGDEEARMAWGTASSIAEIDPFASSMEPGLSGRELQDRGRGAEESDVGGGIVGVQERG